MTCHAKSTILEKTSGASFLLTIPFLVTHSTLSVPPSLFRIELLVLATKYYKHRTLYQFDLKITYQNDKFYKVGVMNVIISNIRAPPPSKKL